MSVWNKTPVAKEDVERLEKKYAVDPLTASIMVRRGLTKGNDILYFMENSLRFQHNPFLFVAMEDVVDRILDAQEEKEKVLIFGDRDVDGITATTVLYDCLASMGIDVTFRLPSGDDTYGLSMEAVDDFSANYGSLIITVDCGISNNAEIAHAGELGIDVIVLDHHNPPSPLPSPALIIDPKIEGSGYPFCDISGCAVVYKVVSALRFSKSKWYKEDLALLNIQEEDGKAVIECLKVRNLAPVSRFNKTIEPLSVGIAQSGLMDYLQGQIVLVWDEKRIETLLRQTFGANIEYSFLDIQKGASSIMPQFDGVPLSKIKGMSRLARYGNHEPTEIGSFYNIFVTYVTRLLAKEFPKHAEQEEKDLELVALAALADIMPMQNENRLFVKQALASINAKKIRPGLLELMANLNLLGKRVTATDLGWAVVSHLNATGRLGKPELAAELFLTKNQARREEVASLILELNKERKALSQKAWDYAAIQAEGSIPQYSGKLCVVIDERINRGVNGILAGKLVSTYDVPAMAVTFVGDTGIGSMRSCRGFDVTTMLDKMADLFLNHGGHNFAAGFSFERKKLAEFEARVKELSKEIELSDSSANAFFVDAEIPSAYLEPKILNILDRFEPFGEDNEPLLFMTQKIRVIDAIIMGKTERQHLKITVDAGKHKWPCIFWGEAERLHRDFEVGDEVDILYRVERNIFNGNEIPQLILSDLRRSS